ncbi:MAG: HAD-IA family hydrolase [Thermotogae bacterium]|nr:HAD-IA family hydrolase [Thermotogota bacterium]MCP5465841.1 HAD-IA family hydrolase [Thermotogota bacterium]HOO73910.1 HAD-IA family hydrolase [Tepiditoga sp.]
MRYENYIWDFDGTLFDTYGSTMKTIEKVFKDHGVNPEMNEIYRDSKEYTLYYAVENAMNKYGVSDGEFAGNIHSALERIDVKERKPFENAEKILAEIIKGGRNYILTNRNENTLLPILEFYDFKKYFYDIITPDTGLESKPDPAMFFHIIKKHNLDIAKTITVGDRKLDIDAGKATGIKTCLIDFDKFLFDIDYDYKVSNFAEFGELFLK